MNIERQMEKSNRRNQRFMRDQFTHEEFPDDREKQQDVPCDIYLFIGLTSNERMEAVIRCAVDLGVYEVIPVETEKGMEGVDLRKVERRRSEWQTIADNVAKEENRSFYPHIHRLVSFAEALVYAKSYCEVCLAAYEKEHDEVATARALKKIKPGKSIGIFIGPVDGFAEAEVSQMERQEMDLISLGKRVMRNDTAAVCAMYTVMRELEKQGK